MSPNSTEIWSNLRWKGFTVFTKIVVIFSFLKAALAQYSHQISPGKSSVRGESDEWAMCRKITDGLHGSLRLPPVCCFALVLLRPVFALGSKHTRYKIQYLMKYYMALFPLTFYYYLIALVTLESFHFCLHFIKRWTLNNCNCVTVYWYGCWLKIMSL